ncbi:DUF433 domain-containing protein [Synechococcus sp. CBW1107]|uniref:DUF433 domain-containing protein n=1 Tax=Synechococcus sp. CBW1107 TaxID=2789857 RepID=UPI002AD5626B|nr:DUF433 domain-containing protein [Synechococcus sp. CBW1107]CAK6686998.1 hypothetical protein MNNICLKF_00128 [Synechococcus sp. CBW1107]
MNWVDCPSVERDSKRLSGVWLFRGSRVPVAALFENLRDGVSLAEFVEIFPGVTTGQAGARPRRQEHNRILWRDAFPLTRPTGAAEKAGPRRPGPQRAW